MSVLAYGKGSYRRLAAGLPELRLINMYIEAAATSQDSVVLLSRPGLARQFAAGAGPVQGIYQRPGTFADTVFVVSGGALHSGSTYLGDVAVAGPASFAASPSELLIAAGAALHRFGGFGMPVEPVVFPDSASVIAVAFIGGLFVAVRANSQRFYWSRVLDGASWDPLDYASAESSPDRLLDAIVIGDVLWLLGTNSIEVWSITGNADLPFSRIEGRNFERGVLGTGCAASLDNTLFWVGDDRRVYRAASVPQGISDPGIEERIAASSAVSAFAIEYEGHKFFCIRLDTATIAFDVATGEWCEFASYGLNNWRIGHAAPFSGTTIMGDADTNEVWLFSRSLFTDNGASIPRLFSAFQPIGGGSSTLDAITLDAEFGSTPLLTGQGADPIVEIRSSRDGGKTWNPWRQASLGRQGEYRHRSSWRRFGSFDAPGALFEIRTSEPIPVRVSAVRANEDSGGRSR